MSLMNIFESYPRGLLLSVGSSAMAVYKRTSRCMKRRSGDTDLDQLAYVKTRCAGLKTLQHKTEKGIVPIKS